jgi:hypothetical protein
MHCRGVFKKLFSLFPILNQVRCRRLFKTLEPLGQKRCESLNSGDPNGTCEQVSVSRYSSKGRVKDEEYLFRFVFDPKDIVDGKIVPAHFDDAVSIGLSTNRGGTRDVTEELREKGRELAATKRARAGDRPLSLFGVFPASCMDVRNLRSSDGSRSFYVFDTAKKDNLDHAEVFQRNQGQSRAERARQRKFLRDLFIPETLRGA